jgi:molecular chaperone DnaJ
VRRDYYEVLGVERASSEGEIKTAFRRLARELHPDVNRHDPAAEEKFKQAAEAYEVLSDPQRRATYDRYGHEGLRTGGFSPHTAGSFEDVLSALFGQSDSLFGDLFGGGRAAGPANGGDVAIEVEITLDEVVTGVTQAVGFEAVSTCEHCHGNGAEPGTPIHTCETCGGAGRVQQVRRSAFGQLVQTGVCPTCGGDGRVAEHPCERCKGIGREVRDRTWDVEIPPGIESGQRIRIAGAGHAGEPGGRPGDLYVLVAVSEDERFERRGEDLITVAQVPATLAMVGGEISVPTLEGEREVEVPAGSQPGDAITLKGLGMPRLRGRGRGAEHVVLDVVVPRKLSRKQRDLARQLHDSLDGKRR